MKLQIPNLIVLLLFTACNLFEVRTASRPVIEADTTTTMADTLQPTFSNAHVDTLVTPDSIPAVSAKNADTVLLPPSQQINTGVVRPDDVVAFAQTLTGTPYVYASANPKRGFDCSGFITYVFNHFGIAVPRSSVGFTRVGKTIAAAQAKQGDLILFTGTDSTEKHIGHMGLVIAADSTALQFIHATSGKAMGVITTPLNAYYKKRFVRIARIFPQNDR